MNTRTAACVALFMALAYLAVPAGASTLRSVPGSAVLVPAGATASISIMAMSLQPGGHLPAGPLTLAQPPLAPERLRTTLFYGIEWGYASSDPKQVALALWYAQDGAWLDPDHTTAERIASAASAMQGTPSWNPEGRSLLTLVAQGQIAVDEIALSGTTQATGTGYIRLRNTTPQDLLVHLPYGTVVGGPTGSAITWSTGVTAQVGTSPTAVATSPADATQEVAQSPTTGPKAGVTAVPDSTEAPGYKATRRTPTPELPTEIPPATEQAPPTEQAEEVSAPADTTVAGKSPDSGSGVTGQAVPAAKPVESSPPTAEAHADAKRKVVDQVPAGGQILNDEPTQQGSTHHIEQLSAPAPELPSSQVTVTPNAPPPPVGTAGSPAGVAPPPVSTGEAAASGKVPPAQGTAPAAIKTVEPFLSPTATTPEKPTSIPLATVAPSTANADSAVAPPKEEIKQPEPAPVPVATPPASDNTATINVSSGSQAADSASAPRASEAPAAAAGPASAPKTGGARSAIPEWATVFALLMVIAGGAVRYSARKMETVA
ncbi:MAG TPA: hypothetical protein VM409_04045 [Chloroflexia bacterium]|nr:hypothetical protein [Chloroflexia bacterium]